MRTLRYRQPMERTDGSAVAEFHQIDSILSDWLRARKEPSSETPSWATSPVRFSNGVFHESSLGPDVPDKRCVVSPNRHDSTLRCEVQGRDGTVVFVRKAIFQLARRDIPEKDVAAFIRSHATQAIRRNRNGLYASFVLAIQGAQWGFAQRVQIVDSYPAVIAAGQHQRCGDPWAGKQSAHGLAIPPGHFLEILLGIPDIDNTIFTAGDDQCLAVDQGNSNRRNGLARVKRTLLNGRSEQGRFNRHNAAHFDMPFVLQIELSFDGEPNPASNVENRLCGLDPFAGLFDYFVPLRPGSQLAKSVAPI